MRVMGEAKPDFKYIVRIADTDIDGNRTVELGLERIKGIGIRTADAIADSLGIPRYEKIGNLKEEQIEAISNALQKLPSIVPPWLLNKRKSIYTGKDLHFIGSDWQSGVRDDINLMKKIRCYKGIRHETGQKVRGQRTKSNGRSGLTVGVSKIRAKELVKEKEKGKAEKK
ncbi:MAG: 30S ribosomal protein S13 [Candidatus Thermoplasmatota archaeon]